MALIDFQLGVIETILKQQYKGSKIFKCPDDLFLKLISMEIIGSYPVIKRSNPKEFQGYVKLNDSNLYLVDTRNTKDIPMLVCAAKEWYYYGELFNTTAYLAIPKAHHRDGRFKEPLKLSSLELEMDNEYLLTETLKEIDKNKI